MAYILADNQELTRKGLESLIQEAALIARHEEELIALLYNHPKSIVLLDITLFDFKDEESLLIVSARFPDSIWLLISDELTGNFIRKVVYSSHNIGILFKNSPVKIIQDAIRSASQGRRYISPSAMEIILKQDTLADEKSSLTDTELIILKNIAQGKTTKEIAAERFCSIHTINAHRKNIFRKLNVNTAHEAVKYAFRAGLVNPSEFYI